MALYFPMYEQSTIHASFQGNLIGKEYLHLAITGSTHDVVFKVHKERNRPEGIVVTVENCSSGCILARCSL